MELKEVIRNLKLIEEGQLNMSALNIKTMANDCRRAIEDLERHYDVAVKDYVMIASDEIKEGILKDNPEAVFDESFYEPFVTKAKESIDHRLCWGNTTTDD